MKITPEEEAQFTNRLDTRFKRCFVLIEECNGYVTSILYRELHENILILSPEINLWLWTAYVQVPKEKAEILGIFHDDYFEYPDNIIAHGGVTYAKMHEDHVEIGWDYMHLWDETTGHPENLTSIRKDIREFTELLDRLITNKEDMETGADE